MRSEYISVLKDTLREIMLDDESAVLMGMNMSAGGVWGESDGLDEVISRRRIIDTPYSISSVLGSALGLAMSGAKPIVAVKGEYLIKAADTIANKIAVNDFITNSQFNSDVLIISELDISAQKGAEIVSAYESIFAQIPGLDVLCVSSPGNMDRILRAAYENDRPTLVFLCAQCDVDCVECDSDEYTVGTAEIVAQGSDVTLITYGQALGKVLRAREKALTEGVSAEVIDLITLSDVDINTIAQSAEKTGRVIIVHDARKNLGISSEVIARIVESDAFFYLEEKIVRLCGKNEAVPYSEELFGDFVPSEEEIYNAIIETCK